MKLAIKLSILSVLSLGFIAAACSDDDGDTAGPTTTTNATTTSSTAGPGGSGGSGGGIPNVPTLGTQIDRKGRPAINTAANNTFAADAVRDAAEDAYNAADDPTTWATDFTMIAAATLGTLDGLNALGPDYTPPGLPSGCGDQVAYAANMTYATLATVLTHDYLIVKGDAAEGCVTFLGVEANYLGVTNDDCGGRTPTYDVIETLYSAVSGVGLAGFDDGIDVKPETQTAYEAGFPYLAAANPPP